jgi:hypothetical protein
MNAVRRKSLRAIITKLEELESLRQEIQEQLEEIMDEEQEALDNMPESLQESERGQQMADNVTNLEYAMDFLDEIDVEEITDLLQTVVEG